MAARFVIRDWNTLDPKDQTNIQSLLQAVIGVDAALDISHETGDMDDIREIELSPLVLAAAGNEYDKCRRAGGTHQQCIRLSGGRAFFTSEYFSLMRGSLSI